MTAFAPYRKSIVAVIVAVIGWAAAVVTSPYGPIAAAEWVGLATVVATAAGVFAIPNTPADGKV